MKSSENPILQDFRIDYRKFGPKIAFQTWDVGTVEPLASLPVASRGETWAHSDQANKVINKLHGVWKAQGAK